MSQSDSGRAHIIESLRRDLLGPDPHGRPIELKQGMKLEKWEDRYGPWIDRGTGEEILCVNYGYEVPTQRYGVGVLFAKSSPTGADSDEGEEVRTIDIEDDLGDDDTDKRKTDSRKDFEKISRRADRRGDHDSSLEDDLEGMHDWNPSALAMTFRFDTSRRGTLAIEVKGGRYEGFTVRTPNKQDGEPSRDDVWWLRKPVNQQADCDVPVEDCDKPVRLKQQGEDDLELAIRIIKRKDFLTVCLLNEESDKTGEESRLFQTEMTVKCLDEDGSSMILPHSDSPEEIPDVEARAMDLLLRHRKTFAVGHGCSVDWGREKGSEFASWVATALLPQVELKNLAYDIEQDLSFSMYALSGKDPESNGLEELSEFISRYGAWIERRKQASTRLSKEHSEIGREHLEDCEHALKRMREGFELLVQDQDVLAAFQLANEAMWRQQLRGNIDRPVSYNPATEKRNYVDPYPSDNTFPDSERKEARWRPFQIGFILMCLSSLADGKGSERRLVDLLWFPTGGGKTEAYLGLSAFSMLLRRIRNREDQGLDVFSRYTLRLLTTQQFQRTARMVCALEYLRRNRQEQLGDAPFSIGLWVGGTVTPNSNENAISRLRQLRNPKKGKSARDWLVLRRCPWCNAEMGVVESYKYKYQDKDPKRTFGYHEHRGEVLVHCPTNDCAFQKQRGGLPVSLVDEQIYKNPPTMLIATIDKFASLTWKPEIRSLFGIDKDGKRVNDPPTLILQDELHLISGPLGTMTGMFESVVEELCSMTVEGVTIRPKILCATATIKGFKSQVKNLFGRTKSAVFPGPGLEIEDSFFYIEDSFCREEDETEEDTNPQGKIYIGVHAPAHGSILTSQVRCFAALLQAPMRWKKEADHERTNINNRDPWWTLATFYTSLKELCAGFTMLQSDVPERLNLLGRRYDLKDDERRPTLLRVEELTSRLGSEEIPMALEKLNKTADQNDAVDVVLASNIIEVGVDIDRLSLMTVVGSPKTVSTYLQATGRVGRREGRPGLIVTIFNFQRPRDRSLYENFRSYHEHMYAGIEATSVTPYSIPALERCLHAAMVAYVRQTGPMDRIKSPNPVPKNLCYKFRDILLERVREAAPDDVPQVKFWFNKRMKHWDRFGHDIWENRTDMKTVPLLRESGRYAPKDWEKSSWPTQWSMRNVDAECRVKISTDYHQPEHNNDD